MMSSDAKPTSELMKYLPAIFHEDRFLDQYLSAFEKILIETGDPHFLSLEAIIAGMARYFDPKKAPDQFLPWLAGWMAFGMRHDLDVEHQRDFLAEVISLYKKRGTSEGLGRLLTIFARAEPTILDCDDLASTDNTDWNVDDGIEKWVADGRPEHAFAVLLSFMGAETDKTAPRIERSITIASALIDLEKPAHTMFYLVPVFPSLKLPEFSTKERNEGKVDPDARSRVGMDTLLGVRSTKKAKKGESDASRKAR